MIAVTIGVGQEFKRASYLVANQVERMTGLRTAIIDETQYRRFSYTSPIYLTLNLFDLFPNEESILYFDSDMWFATRWDPNHFEGIEDFVCVRDACAQVVREECDEFSIKPHNYFNAGFFIANKSFHNPVLRLAQRICEKYSFHLRFWDQTPLNQAVQELSVPLKFLSQRYNFFLGNHEDLVLRNPREIEKSGASIIHFAGGARQALIEALQRLTEAYSAHDGFSRVWRQILNWSKRGGKKLSSVQTLTRPSERCVRELYAYFPDIRLQVGVAGQNEECSLLLIPDPVRSTEQQLPATRFVVGRYKNLEELSSLERRLTGKYRIAIMGLERGGTFLAERETSNTECRVTSGMLNVFGYAPGRWTHSYVFSD